MKRYPLMAFVAILSFAYIEGKSQNIVLVNGKASQVTLNGTIITSVIHSDMSDYMSDFSLAPNEDFKKTDFEIVMPDVVLHKYERPTSEMASISYKREESQQLLEH